jgi:hypothetical protein
VNEDLPDWERLLAAERHVQALVPGSVLVGGTAAAIHASHRQSLDGDHVLIDLRDRFDEVRLEAAAGWQTERLQRPVMILGNLDGIQSGIRQLRRKQPLAYEVVNGLRVPTLPEMARIKAWLLATRNTVRDYLDLVVLLDRLGDEGALNALRELDSFYEQDNRASVLVEVIDRLARAEPSDRDRIDLSTYRGLNKPWNDWDHLRARGRHFGTLLAPLSLQRNRQS